jgi:hypothetical protein
LALPGLRVSFTSPTSSPPDGIVPDVAGTLHFKKERTMDMRTHVVALDGTQAKKFCTRLWFELTIVGRAIWSDETLDAAAQLNALKWLNEIQHRVWGAHASLRPDALANLLDRIISHCEQAPPLQCYVRMALDSALRATTGAAPDSADAQGGLKPPM